MTAYVPHLALMWPKYACGQGRAPHPEAPVEHVVLGEMLQETLSLNIHCASPTLDVYCGMFAVVCTDITYPQVVVLSSGGASRGGLNHEPFTWGCRICPLAQSAPKIPKLVRTH